MRITESQLRRIVREEVLREMVDTREALAWAVDGLPVGPTTARAIRDLLADEHGLAGARVSFHTRRPVGRAPMPHEAPEAVVRIEHPALGGGSIELDRRGFREEFLAP